MSKKTNKGEEASPAHVGDLLTINSLRETVAALEETKLKLLVSLQDARDQLKQQKTDQADIYYYLNKKCDESFEVIASLEEQLLNEQSDREISEKAFESRYEDLRMSSAQTEAKLNAKISDLESRLEMLNNFSEMKEELNNKLATANILLEEERAKYSHDIEMLENRFLVEREKMKRNFELNFEAAKRELESTVDKKLSGKVRNTQVMNVLVRKELESQSKHAEKLLEINENMQQRDRDLKLELQISRSLQEEMATKLTAYQRTIRQLNEKLAAQEAEKQRISVERSDEAKLQRSELETLREELTRLRKRNSKESLQLDEMWQFVSSAFRRIRRVAERKGRAATGPAAGSVSVDALSELSDPETNFDHEQILIDLVREVVNKYPRILAGIRAGQSQANSATNSQRDRDRENGKDKAERDLSLDDLGSASILEREPYIITGINSWDMRGGEKFSLSKDDLQHSTIDSLIGSQITSGKNYGGSVGSISKSLSKTRLHQPRFKNVGVQTEGKVAMYPPGSKWLNGDSDAEKEKGQERERGRWQQGATITRRKRSVSATADKGRSHIDAQSLPTTLWGDSQSLTGQDGKENSTDGRTVQSASGVENRTALKTGAPKSKADIRGRSARRSMQLQLQQLQQQQKRGGIPNPASAFPVAGISARLPYLKNYFNSKNDASAQSQSKAERHGLSADSPSSISLGSKYPYPPSAGRSSNLNSDKISISGQGFVSPLQLPRL